MSVIAALHRDIQLVKFRKNINVVSKFQYPFFLRESGSQRMTLFQQKRAYVQLFETIT